MPVFFQKSIKGLYIRLSVFRDPFYINLINYTNVTADPMMTYQGYSK